MNAAKALWFVLVLFLQFTLSTGMMFYKKEFFKFVPFPFFTSFANGLCMIPISFFLAWGSHGFTRSLTFLIPPKRMIVWLIASGVIHAVSVILTNVGFFASDLDFVLLMRLTGLVWHSLLGFMFLGERLSLLGCAAVFIVIVGILIIVSDFQWSVARMPSVMQIVVQMASIMLMSVGALVTKKIMLVISQTETKFKILDYLVWTSLMSIPTTFIASLWNEPGAWISLSQIVTWKMAMWVLFGTVIHESMHLVIAEVHKLASLISMGVISQLRIVGTLTVSHFVYNETNWDLRKLIGVTFLFMGGLVYSTTRMEGAEVKSAKPNDKEVLVSDKGTFSEASESA